MPGDSLTSSIGPEQLASTSEARRILVATQKDLSIGTTDRLRTRLKSISRGDYDHEPTFHNQVHFDVITDLCFDRLCNGPIEE